MTPRNSHGLRVVRVCDTDAAMCPRCLRMVKMNGPGSDNGLFARLLHGVLDTLLPEVQERFWAAADRHDMDCHFGPNDKELDEANKAFRMNCYKAIADHYGPLQKSLSASLRRAGGPCTFFEAMFSAKKRECWAMGKELRRLLDDRKEEERWAEVYYTALDIGARALVPSVPCTDPARDGEETLKV